jgi:hypothetical protein
MQEDNHLPAFFVFFLNILFLRKKYGFSICGFDRNCLEMFQVTGKRLGISKFDRKYHSKTCGKTCGYCE